ncbi:MAG: hypothetical protein V4669_16240 [Pseudomonadota bacterium]
MAETDFAVFESKNEGDRTFMYILYGLHTIAWASFGSLAVIALILNYVKRSDEQDAVYASHHNYMISTFWWTLLWLVVTSPLYILFFVPGLIAWTIVGLWYLYRCLRGIVKFADGKPPF